MDAKDPPPPSIEGLIRVAVGTGGDEAIRWAESCFDGDHPGVATAAADALGSTGKDASVKALERLADSPLFDKHYGLRFAATRSLVRIGTPSAIDVLRCWRDRLGGQLAAEIDRELMRDDDHQASDGTREAMPASDAGRIPAPVLDDNPIPRLERHTADGDGASYTAARPPLVRGPSYYGIPIEAAKVLFVLDHSGSMRDYVGGGTRLEKAKVELLSAVESLPPATAFAVCVFSDRVRFWRPELALASEENKRSAERFVTRLGYGDKTATHEALVRSLAFDPQLEAAYVLTDGRPTAGVTRPAVILRDVADANRLRHVRIHAIGVAVAGPMRQFLRRLSEATGGQFRALP